MPQRMQATREFVWQIEDEFDITDRALSTRIANWVVQHVEDEGASRAAMTFTEDGGGPLCSWCGGIWGLCVHGSDSEWYKADDDCASCGHSKDGHDGGGKCLGGDTITHRCRCATYTAPPETGKDGR